jgi:salicylate synthase
LSGQSEDVYRDHVIGIGIDPLESISLLAASMGDEDYFVYENEGTWTVALGVAAELWIDGDGGHLRGPAVRRDIAWADDPFARVQSLLAELPLRRWCAYGWASFELAYRMDGEQVAVGSERLLHLVVPRTEIRLTAERVRVRSMDDAVPAVVEEALRGLPVDDRSSSLVQVDVGTPGAREYRAAVDRAVAAIEAKALDKVVLSRTVPVPADLDFVETYVAGRRMNSPARSFLMSLDGIDALGFSPETIVRVERSGAVMSQPLAGTRALTADPKENARLGRELLSDPKEVFEHAVSVKAVRDELGQVCDEDSLAITEFMGIQERGSAQHLASRLTGQLGRGGRAWDAFRALFPAVTATGVPKWAACALIRELEPERRGLYGGAVLTLDHEGVLDAALVLRALYRQHGRTWLRAGGGIVAQSRAARELEETCEKFGSLVRSLVPRVPATVAAR